MAESEVRLTRLAKCAGCGAKVGAGVLATLLGDMRVLSDPNLLVGFDKSDDNVLDGNGFYLSYFTEDNQQISASGYMKYPDGYSTFKNDIISFYEKYFLEEKETTDLQFFLYS